MMISDDLEANDLGSYYVTTKGSHSIRLYTRIVDDFKSVDAYFPIVRNNWHGFICRIPYAITLI